MSLSLQNGVHFENGSWRRLTLCAYIVSFTSSILSPVTLRLEECYHCNVECCGGHDVSCGSEVQLTREVNTQRFYIIVMAFDLPVGCGERFSFFSTFQREIPSDENTDLLVTVHMTWQSY